VRKNKICIVTSNRAEYPFMKTIMDNLKEYDLVVMGSHNVDLFGSSIDCIKKDGYKISRVLKTTLSSGDPSSMVYTNSVTMMQIMNTLEDLNPDLVVIPSDRYEMLAVATAAAISNRRVVHLFGGEQTGTIDESIRHAITKLSHLHLVATKKSKENVILLGENPKHVYQVGTPDLDGLNNITKPLKECFGIKTNKKFNPKKPYIIFSQHPVTTEYGQSAKQIEITLEALNELNIQTLLIWPNIDAGSIEMSKVIKRYLNKPFINNFAFKHLPFEDFMVYLKHSKGMVGNSSAGIRETASFGIGTVNIGSRQFGRETSGNVIHVPHDKHQIKKAVLKMINTDYSDIKNIYGDGKSGKRIANILSSINIDEIPIQKVLYRQTTNK